MERCRLLLILLFVSGTLPGCVPCIWGLPPVRAEAGAAWRDRPPSDGGDDAVVPIRASVQPLQMLAYGRPADAGLGYQFVGSTRKPGLHGPYLDLAYLMPLGVSSGRGWRANVRVRGHMLHFVNERRPWGWGASLQAGIEWVDIVSGPFAGCSDPDDPDPDDYPESPYDQDPFEEDDDEFSCAAGVAEGEFAAGFFAEATYTDIDDVRMPFVGGGFSLRIPASFGAGFVFLDW